jgi:hypothetical protein
MGKVPRNALLGLAIGIAVGLAVLAERKTLTVENSLAIQSDDAMPTVAAPSDEPEPPDIAPATVAGDPVRAKIDAHIVKRLSGPVSINELQALSAIANGAPYRSPPSGIPAPSAPALNLVNPRPAVPQLGYRPRSTEASDYRGMSGARYQYDLSTPGDRVRYTVDPQARLRDSISVDPRRGIDQNLGQTGGGIIR